MQRNVTASASISTTCGLSTVRHRRSRHSPQPSTTANSSMSTFAKRVPKRKNSACNQNSLYPTVPQNHVDGARSSGQYARSAKPKYHIHHAQHWCNQRQLGSDRRPPEIQSHRGGNNQCGRKKDHKCQVSEVSGE